MDSMFRKTIMSCWRRLRSQFRSRDSGTRPIQNSRRTGLTLESLENRDVPTSISSFSLTPIVQVIQASPSAIHFIEWHVDLLLVRQDQGLESKVLARSSPEFSSPLSVSAAKDRSSLALPTPPSAPANNEFKVPEPRGTESTPFLTNPESFFATLQTQARQVRSAFFNDLGADVEGSQGMPSNLPPFATYLAEGQQPFQDDVLPPSMFLNALERFGMNGDGPGDFPAPGSFRLLLPFFAPLFGRPSPVSVLFPLQTAPVAIPSQDTLPTLQAPPLDLNLDLPRPAASLQSSTGTVTPGSSISPAFLSAFHSTWHGFERIDLAAALTWQATTTACFVGDLRPILEPAVLAELLIPEISPAVAHSIHVLRGFVAESLSAVNDVGGEVSQSIDWTRIAAAAALAGLIEAARAKRKKQDVRQSTALEIPGITAPAALT